MIAIREDLKKSFWFNLLLVLLLAAGFYVLFFTSLSWITRHGKEVKVPDITAQDVNLAVGKLEQMGFEVDIDSAYEPKQKAYLVLSQIPEKGAVVKNGRTIFLTVNKAQPPLTPMPNLLNLSFRSAEMILKSNKMILGDTTYRPDIAKGAILEQLFKGQPIRPGQMIPQGSRIDLVIGDGLGNTQFNVPDVIGMSYVEGVAMLNGNGLVFTAIWEGQISDSATAIIYNQTPKSINEIGTPNRIKEGDIVDIRIKQNPTPEEIEGNRNAHSGVNNDGNGNTDNSNKGNDDYQ